MNGSITLHEVTLGELRAGEPTRPWRDPHGFSRMREAKRAIWLSCPLGRDDRAVVRVLAVADDEIVGKEEMLPGELIADGEPIQTDWGSGMFVPETHRGRGIGRMLAQHRMALREVCCSCGVSSMLFPIYRKLGWHDLSMKRFIMLRSAKPVARRFCGDGALASVATTAGDLALAAHGGLLAVWMKLKTSGLMIERLDAAPHEWDAHFQTQQPGVRCHRSAAWLNWLLTHRLTDDPRAAADLWVIRDARGEQLGYVLTKTRYHGIASHRGFRDVLLGSLQDWMIFQPERLSFHAMLLLAARMLSRSGVDAVEVCLPPDADNERLRAMGFMRVGSQHTVFSATPGSRLALPALSRPASWFIRPGDGDNFFT
ncbi:MAG TPA: GNAT family N-acetyltransferase [Phycisphaerales bacterium]|nr:GNAT family N-acetyltransferase [Phycisphaerales bacterium]